MGKNTDTTSEAQGEGQANTRPYSRAGSLKSFRKWLTSKPDEIEAEATKETLGQRREGEKVRRVSEASSSRAANEKRKSDEKASPSSRKSFTTATEVEGEGTSSRRKSKEPEKEEKKKKKLSISRALSAHLLHGWEDEATHRPCGCRTHPDEKCPHDMEVELLESHGQGGSSPSSSSPSKVEDRGKRSPSKRRESENVKEKEREGSVASSAARSKRGRSSAESNNFDMFNLRSSKTSAASRQSAKSITFDDIDTEVGGLEDGSATKVSGISPSSDESADGSRRESGVKGLMRRLFSSGEVLSEKKEKSELKRSTSGASNRFNEAPLKTVQLVPPTSTNSPAEKSKTSQEVGKKEKKMDEDRKQKDRQSEAKASSLTPSTSNKEEVKNQEGGRKEEDRRRSVEGEESRRKETEIGKDVTERKGQEQQQSSPSKIERQSSSEGEKRRSSIKKESAPDEGDNTSRRSEGESDSSKDREAGSIETQSKRRGSLSPKQQISHENSENAKEKRLSRQDVSNGSNEDAAKREGSGDSSSGRRRSSKAEKQLMIESSTAAQADNSSTGKAGQRSNSKTLKSSPLKDLQIGAPEDFPAKENSAAESSSKRRDSNAREASKSEIPQRSSSSRQNSDRNEELRRSTQIDSTPVDDSFASESGVKISSLERNLGTGNSKEEIQTAEKISKAALKELRSTSPARDKTVDGSAARRSSKTSPQVQEERSSSKSGGSRDSTPTRSSPTGQKVERRKSKSDSQVVSEELERGQDISRQPSPARNASVGQKPERRGSRAGSQAEEELFDKRSGISRDSSPTGNSADRKSEKRSSKTGSQMLEEGFERRKESSRDSSPSRKASQGKEQRYENFQEGSVEEGTLEKNFKSRSQTSEQVSINQNTERKDSKPSSSRRSGSSRDSSPIREASSEQKTERRSSKTSIQIEAAASERKLASSRDSSPIREASTEQRTERRGSKTSTQIVAEASERKPTTSRDSESSRSTSPARRPSQANSQAVEEAYGSSGRSSDRSSGRSEDGSGSNRSGSSSPSSKQERSERVSSRRSSKTDSQIIAEGNLSLEETTRSSSPYRKSAADGESGQTSSKSDAQAGERDLLGKADKPRSPSPGREKLSERFLGKKVSKEEAFRVEDTIAVRAERSQDQSPNIPSRRRKSIEDNAPIRSQESEGKRTKSPPRPATSIREITLQDPSLGNSRSVSPTRRSSIGSTSSRNIERTSPSSDRKKSAEKVEDDRTKSSSPTRRPSKSFDTSSQVSESVERSLKKRIEEESSLPGELEDDNSSSKGRSPLRRMDSLKLAAKHMEQYHEDDEETSHDWEDGSQRAENIRRLSAGSDNMSIYSASSSSPSGRSPKKRVSFAQIVQEFEHPEIEYDEEGNPIANEDIPETQPRPPLSPRSGQQPQVQSPSKKPNLRKSSAYAEEEVGEQSFSDKSVEKEGKEEHELIVEEQRGIGEGTNLGDDSKPSEDSLQQQNPPVEKEVVTIAAPEQAPANEQDIAEEARGEDQAKEAEASVVEHLSSEVGVEANEQQQTIYAVELSPSQTDLNSHSAMNDSFSTPIGASHHQDLELTESQGRDAQALEAALEQTTDRFMPFVVMEQADPSLREQAARPSDSSSSWNEEKLPRISSKNLEELTLPLPPPSTEETSARSAEDRPSSDPVTFHFTPDISLPQTASWAGPPISRTNSTSSHLTPSKTDSDTANLQALDSSAEFSSLLPRFSSELLLKKISSSHSLKSFDLSVADEYLSVDQYTDSEDTNVRRVEPRDEREHAPQPENSQLPQELVETAHSPSASQAGAFNQPSHLSDATAAEEHMVSQSSQPSPHMSMSLHSDLEAMKKTPAQSLNVKARPLHVSPSSSVQKVPSQPRPASFHHSARSKSPPPYSKYGRQARDDSSLVSPAEKEDSHLTLKEGGTKELGGLTEGSSTSLDHFRDDETAPAPPDSPKEEVKRQSTLKSKAKPFLHVSPTKSISQQTLKTKASSFRHPTSSSPPPADALHTFRQLLSSPRLQKEAEAEAEITVSQQAHPMAVTPAHLALEESVLTQRILRNKSKSFADAKVGEATSRDTTLKGKSSSFHYVPHSRSPPTSLLQEPLEWLSQKFLGKSPPSSYPGEDKSFEKAQAPRDLGTISANDLYGPLPPSAPLSHSLVEPTALDKAETEESVRESPLPPEAKSALSKEEVSGVEVDKSAKDAAAGSIQDQSEDLKRHSETFVSSTSPSSASSTSQTFHLFEEPKPKAEQKSLKTKARSFRQPSPEQKGILKSKTLSFHVPSSTSSTTSHNVLGQQKPVRRPTPYPVAATEGSPKVEEHQAKNQEQSSAPSPPRVEAPSLKDTTERDSHSLPIQSKGVVPAEGEKNLSQKALKGKAKSFRASKLKENSPLKEKTLSFHIPTPTSSSPRDKSDLQKPLRRPTPYRLPAADDSSDDGEKQNIEVNKASIPVTPPAESPGSKETTEKAQLSVSASPKALLEAERDERLSSKSLKGKAKSFKAPEPKSNSPVKDKANSFRFPSSSSPRKEESMRNSASPRSVSVSLALHADVNEGREKSAPPPVAVLRLDQISDHKGYATDSSNVVKEEAERTPVGSPSSMSTFSRSSSPLSDGGDAEGENVSKSKAKSFRQQASDAKSPLKSKPSSFYSPSSLSSPIEEQSSQVAVAEASRTLLTAVSTSPSRILKKSEPFAQQVPKKAEEVVQPSSETKARIPPKTKDIITTGKQSTSEVKPQMKTRTEATVTGRSKSTPNLLPKSQKEAESKEDNDSEVQIDNLSFSSSSATEIIDNISLGSSQLLPEDDIGQESSNLHSLQKKEEGKAMERQPSTLSIPEPKKEELHVSPVKESRDQSTSPSVPKTEEQLATTSSPFPPTPSVSVFETRQSHLYEDKQTSIEIPAPPRFPISVDTNLPIHSLSFAASPSVATQTISVPTMLTDTIIPVLSFPPLSQVVAPPVAAEAPIKQLGRPVSVVKLDLSAMLADSDEEDEAEVKAEKPSADQDEKPPPDPAKDIPSAPSPPPRSPPPPKAPSSSPQRSPQRAAQPRPARSLPAATEGEEYLVQVHRDVESSTKAEGRENASDDGWKTDFQTSTEVLDGVVVVITSNSSRQRERRGKQEDTERITAPISPTGTSKRKPQTAAVIKPASPPPSPSTRDSGTQTSPPSSRKKAKEGPPPTVSSQDRWRGQNVSSSLVKDQGPTSSVMIEKSFVASLRSSSSGPVLRRVQKEKEKDSSRENDREKARERGIKTSSVRPRRPIFQLDEDKLPRQHQSYVISAAVKQWEETQKGLRITPTSDRHARRAPSPPARLPSSQGSGEKSFMAPTSSSKAKKKTTAYAGLRGNDRSKSAPKRRPPSETVPSSSSAALIEISGNASRIKTERSLDAGSAVSEGRERERRPPPIRTENLVVSLPLPSQAAGVSSGVNSSPNSRRSPLKNRLTSPASSPHLTVSSPFLSGPVPRRKRLSPSSTSANGLYSPPPWATDYPEQPDRRVREDSDHGQDTDEGDVEVRRAPPRRVALEGKRNKEGTSAASPSSVGPGSNRKEDITHITLDLRDMKSESPAGRPITTKGDPVKSVHIVNEVALKALTNSPKNVKKLNPAAHKMSSSHRNSPSSAAGSTSSSLPTTPDHYASKESGAFLLSPVSSGPSTPSSFHHSSVLSPTNSYAGQNGASGGSGDIGHPVTLPEVEDEAIAESRVLLALWNEASRVEKEAGIGSLPGKTATDTMVATVVQAESFAKESRKVNTPSDEKKSVHAMPSSSGPSSAISSKQKQPQTIPTVSDVQLSPYNKQRDRIKSDRTAAQKGASSIIFGPSDEETSAKTELKGGKDSSGIVSGKAKAKIDSEEKEHLQAMRNSVLLEAIKQPTIAGSPLETTSPTSVTPVEANVPRRTRKPPPLRNPLSTPNVAQKEDENIVMWGDHF